MVEIIANAIDPTPQNKYVDMICRMIDNNLVEENISRQNKDDLIGYLTDVYHLDKNYLKMLSHSQLFILYHISDRFFTSRESEIREIKKFIDYNERGLIINKDVNTYKSFDDMMSAMSLAEMKSFSKDMEKQAHIVYQDNKWVILRPLTYEASCKYGAATKWCTTDRNKEYFLRYWSECVLIYVINKQTGYKFAVSKNLVSSYEDDKKTQFWNSKDKETGIGELELSMDEMFIITLIMTELNRKLTNEQLCDDELKTKVRKDCRIEEKKEEITVRLEPGNLIPVAENEVLVGGEMRWNGVAAMPDVPEPVPVVDERQWLAAADALVTLTRAEGELQEDIQQA